MDSLQRFSIERLTSPTRTPSSKGHTGWAGASPSSTYPVPAYGHTATGAERTYPWNPGYTHQSNAAVKPYKQVDPVSKLEETKDGCLTAPRIQTVSELKSLTSSNLSSGNIEQYNGGGYTQCKLVSRPAENTSRTEIQDGRHLGGKRRQSSEEDSKIDVVECEKSEDKERKSSESQDEEDGTGKPEHSYIALISMSILASIEKKLVLSDIYQYIMDNFQYYNNQERAWRNSIRHNLSLNECFIKAGRAENGKGNYWAIHPACIEDFSKGDYRRRHARRRARGGPYSDINVSSLPYNYRCNLGYVPMSHSPAIGYPYPLSYLHGLPSTASATSLLRDRSETINSPTAIHSSPNPTIPPPSIATTKAERNHVAGLPVKDTLSGQDFKHLTGLTSSSLPNLSSAKTASLLPQSYLPNMLSPSIRYSPYGFPFF